MIGVVSIDDPSGSRNWGAKELRALANQVEDGEINCLQVIAITVEEENRLYFLRGWYESHQELYLLAGAMAKAQHRLLNTIKDGDVQETEND